MSRTRTDEEMAAYVRDHRCHNADPSVTIADWDRGVAALAAAPLPEPVHEDNGDGLCFECAELWPCEACHIVECGRCPHRSSCPGSVALALTEEPRSTREEAE